MVNQKILWLIPALLALHNLEEFFVMHNALPGPIPKFPEWIQEYLPAVTGGQFAAALILITIIPCLILVFTAITSRWKLAALVLIQFQIVVFLNVFSHLAGAFLMGGFSPGIVTAILLNFPFSLFLFRHALRNEWARPGVFAGMFPLGLVILGPGMVGILKMIRYVAERF